MPRVDCQSPAVLIHKAMNKEVAFSLLQKSFSVASGIVATFLVLLFLSAYRQGCCYAFASVLAIQVFFGLGLRQVLSYEFSSSALVGLDPAVRAKSLELQRLLYASRRIYMASSAAFGASSRSATSLVITLRHQMLITSQSYSQIPRTVVGGLVTS